MLIISFIPEVFHSAKSEEEKQATEFSQPCLSETQFLLKNKPSSP